MSGRIARDRRVVRFGVFEVDLDAGELRRRGARRHLPLQPFRLLEKLIERPGEVVTRRDLRAMLWPDETHGDFEHGLNAAMNKLRRALGDSATNPRFIETLPRRGYRFLVETSGPAAVRSRATRVMLAVLPFGNASGDPAQDLFADGLTREMTIRLGRISPKRLGVIASAPALRLEGRFRDPGHAARKLGVDFVLDGDVRRSNGRIRISAQLINATDHTSTWAESFDREVQDEFDLQREIAAHVAGALALEFLPPPDGTTSATRDPEAREAILLGRHHLNRRNPDGLLKALACCREAVSRDPEDAEAHACLAEVRVLCAAYGLVPPERALPDARAEVIRALTLDPTVPDGHSVLASIRDRYDWDREEADSGFERGLGLDPNGALGRHLRAQFLSHIGRHDEAIRVIREARRLSPLSLVIRSEESCLLTNARRFDEAVEAARRALDLDASFAVAHHSLFRALHALGRHREAVRAARRAVELEPRIPYLLAGLGVAEAAAGNRERAVAVLGNLESPWPDAYVSPIQRARVRSALGDRDGALDLIDLAVRERAFEAVELDTDPEWDPLRDDARFQAALVGVGLRRPAGARAPSRASSG